MIALLYEAIILHTKTENFLKKIFALDTHLISFTNLCKYFNILYKRFKLKLSKIHGFFYIGDNKRASYYLSRTTSAPVVQDLIPGISIITLFCTFFQVTI